MTICVCSFPVLCACLAGDGSVCLSVGGGTCHADIVSSGVLTIRGTVPTVFLGTFEALKVDGSALRVNHAEDFDTVVFGSNNMVVSSSGQVAIGTATLHVSYFYFALVNMSMSMSMMSAV